MCFVQKQWFYTFLFVSFFFPALAIAGANPGSNFRGKCIRGDCFNGEGVMEFPNGDEYHGSFRDGEAYGDGVMKFANGNNYYGHWEHNMREGKGRFTFAIGHEYLGYFRQNHMHGKGVMRFANGDRYEGEWELSKPHGFGVYSFHTGDRYEGGFRQGRFHGFGTFYYTSGAVFEGTWMNNKKHGRGTLTDADGHKTVGEWIYGKAVGKAAIPDDNLTILEVPEEEETPSAAIADNWGDVKIWAVIVGIADYTTMRSLQYSDDDAYKYYSFLKSPEGGAVPDRQIKLLINNAATRDAIIDALYTTYARADENDVVVFYYSGHGLNGALVPVDFDGVNKRLYHDELKQAFEACKARHKLLIADACYAGSLLSYNGMGDALAARGDAIQEMIKRFYQDFESAQPGMAVILSSNQDDLSYEDNGIQSGVFSHFLMRGLAGDADKNHDGLVVLSEIAPFVIKKVSNYTVGAQTPILLGDADDKLPMAVLRR